MNPRTIAMGLCRVPLYTLAVFVAALAVVSIFNLEGAMPRVLMLVMFVLPLFLIAEIALLVAFSTLKERSERSRGRAWWPALVPVALVAVAASVRAPSAGARFELTRAALASLEISRV